MAANVAFTQSAPASTAPATLDANAIVGAVGPALGQALQDALPGILGSIFGPSEEEQRALAEEAKRKELLKMVTIGVVAVGGLVLAVVAYKALG